MVGQGRIGELISAKPQARRALLEEAAGISGLHSRRHEAELRLRAAETNLERLDDVVGQLDTQLESLKRQARQANRYRNLSGEIRKTEALLFHLKWVAAKASEAEAESALSAFNLAMAEKAELQGNLAKEAAVAAHKLPGLRDAQASAASSAATAADRQGHSLRKRFRGWNSGASNLKIAKPSFRATLSGSSKFSMTITARSKTWIRNRPNWKGKAVGLAR